MTRSLRHRICWGDISRQTLRKCLPHELIHTPVMFLVAVGTLVTGLAAIVHPSVLTVSLTVWLLLTVVFGQRAEALAQARGRAQADSLRASQSTTSARREGPEGIVEVPAASLRPGDVVVVAAGETIPGDGDVIEGAATVDESAVTGESAPVIREAGGDRCAVTGGTTVLSDSIRVRITSRPGETFIDRMIGLVEGASRRKTPNEVALTIFLAVLTLVFLIVVTTLAPIASASGAGVDLPVLVALLVCLVPTTIGALLSAIGIAGMDRLVSHNVLAMSGRAVEAAGDVTTLRLDKTGTITIGDRQARRLTPVGGVGEDELVRCALVASLADETPEGRSIVALARGLNHTEFDEAHYLTAEFIPFSATTRVSGVDLGGGHTIIKGAASEILGRYERSGGDEAVSKECRDVAEGIAQGGGTALVVAECEGERVRLIGVIALEDVIKDGIAKRFERLREMGIRTVMITGDNPLTARAIAAQAGVDDFLAEAKPEDKLALIRKEQAAGNLVAMTGDGTNDAPALAQADVGVAMNTGTSAAKEAANMVDLDSDPTKLIDVVHIGKQLLITRGALTTFSIANDVAKYFAIIPAIFMTALPQLAPLNIMGLSSPNSAILSAVIFNALIIVALIPLALKGVAYRAASASRLLARNLVIYGLGGIIAPFIGIKVIDIILTFLGVA